ncbi:MAG: hypothetical protein ACKVZJ_14045 [Phycisphaerales bacterium]
MPFRIKSIGFFAANDPLPLAANQPLEVTRLDGGVIEPYYFQHYMLQSVVDDETLIIGAFVRGATPSFVVTFSAEDEDAGPATITSINVDGGLLVASPRDVVLDIDDEETQALQFALSAPLPNAIGRTRVRLQWSIARNGGEPEIAGISTLVFYTVDALPADLDLGGFGPWRYLEVLQWSCTIAAGQHGPANILNALHAGIAGTGLHYGLIDPMEAISTVQRMIQAGGGMCAVWAALFQAMAAWQGINVERRGFRLLWSNLDHGQSAWAAAVVANNFGVGRVDYPGGEVIQLAPACDYHDYAGTYPPVALEPPVVNLNTRRYRFWANKEHPNTGDGHMLAFFDHANGNVTVYDPSFGARATIAMPMPPNGFTRQTGDDIAPFKTSYLDPNFQYLMGTLRQDQNLYSAAPPIDEPVGTNGMTVRTPQIPAANLTLIWNDA